MFIGFVEALRRGGIPASLKEHLLLLEALDRGFEAKLKERLAWWDERRAG